MEQQIVQYLSNNIGIINLLSLVLLIAIPFSGLIILIMNIVKWDKLNSDRVKKIEELNKIFIPSGKKRKELKYSLDKIYGFNPTKAEKVSKGIIALYRSIAICIY